MTIVPGVIAALFLAVVAAALVIDHDTPVQNAGKAIGYVPPVTGQKVLVLGGATVPVNPTS
jgi:hypothetical protein